MAANHVKGAYGEDVAVRYLCDKGYALEARNTRSIWGEIDFIASRGDQLVFAEVKTRREGAMVGGAEAVTYSKQRKLRRTAECYLSNRNEHRQPRFDVFCVTLRTGRSPLVEHIENAF